MQIIDFINSYDTPQNALKAVQNTPAPYRKRRAKKLLCKLIRTYIYLTKQP